MQCHGIFVFSRVVGTYDRYKNKSTLLSLGAPWDRPTCPHGPTAFPVSHGE
jgi:hypothetical protein